MSKLDRFKRRATGSSLAETDAERMLWINLDRIALAGTHFRRQVKIGPYRADFGCMRLKLLVEIDGPIHETADRSARDRLRTDWLENEGFRIIRFSNHQVTTDMNFVLSSIEQAVQGRIRLLGSAATHPTPALRADPPPRGEGEEPKDA